MKTIPAEEDRTRSSVQRRSIIVALIAAGEAVFLLPFVLARVFRPTFLDVFGITEDQLAVGIPTVRRRSSFAEAAGVGGPASISDVRAVVREIAKSFIVSTGQV